ncbi:hypothetical protein BC938DRAFT_478485, partial [Jimgerdemannia flammicorona]
KYAASYNHKRLPLARTSKIPSAHGPRRPNLAQYLIDGLIVFKVNSGHPSRPHHISRRFVGLSKLCFIPPIRFCIRLLMSDFCVHRQKAETDLGRVFLRQMRPLGLTGAAKVLDLHDLWQHVLVHCLIEGRRGVVTVQNVVPTILGFETRMKGD